MIYQIENECTDNSKVKNQRSKGGACGCQVWADRYSRELSGTDISKMGDTCHSLVG